MVHKSLFRTPITTNESFRVTFYDMNTGLLVDGILTRFKTGFVQSYASCLCMCRQSLMSSYVLQRGASKRGSAEPA